MLMQSGNPELFPFFTTNVELNLKSRTCLIELRNSDSNPRKIGMVIPAFSKFNDVIANNTMGMLTVPLSQLNAYQWPEFIGLAKFNLLTRIICIKACMCSIYVGLFIFWIIKLL